MILWITSPDFGLYKGTCMASISIATVMEENESLEVGSETH